jgi:hypothetical protein
LDPVVRTIVDLWGEAQSRFQWMENQSEGSSITNKFWRSSSSAIRRWREKRCALIRQFAAQVSESAPQWVQLRRIWRAPDKISLHFASED